MYTHLYKQELTLSFDYIRNETLHDIANRRSGRRFSHHVTGQAYFRRLGTTQHGVPKV